jgi:hypothetical protein
MGTAPTENALREAVSLDTLMAHNAEIAKGVRLSGSADEAEAFAYIAAQCRSYGMAVEQYATDAYVSLPGHASLAIVAPERREVECITHSASRGTGPDGLSGSLVYAGAGLAADYARVDARGKIALVDGLAAPPKAFAADAAGVLGIVCINPPQFHEMTVSPVWGTPTPETAPRLPKVVALSVRKADGEALKALTERGPVTVHITAEVETGWRSIPTITAELRGTLEDRFVLLSGHVDSWHHGAMDNASANATMLEVGRIVSEHRGALRRGLRLAFWSGHSHARYASSAWYADNFWPDLRDHCVCHVNAESTGAVGADFLAAAGMAETWQFAAGPIRDVAGQELRYQRMGRSHDQSFTGVGIPSVLCGLAAQPGGGLGWWHHTTEDTLDKIDPANLVRDTQIYLLTCWRLCMLPTLPFNFVETARELRDRLRALEESAGGQFDLTPLIAEADALHAAAERLNHAISEAGDAEARTEQLNATIMAVAHALIPVNYTKAGPYEVDLALANPVLPGLTAAASLSDTEATGDDAGFLRTRLVRERNRVWHALATARREIERATARDSHAVTGESRGVRGRAS